MDVSTSRHCLGHCGQSACGVGRENIEASGITVKLVVFEAKIVVLKNTGLVNS